MHGAVLGHDEDVLALQDVGGGQCVGNFDGHPTLLRRSGRTFMVGCGDGRADDLRDAGDYAVWCRPV